MNSKKDKVTYKISNFIANIKNSKKTQYIILSICIILLLVLSFSSFSSSKKENANSQLNYVSDLENRLSNTLSKVKGAGKVSVVITVESGMETVLASKVTITDNQYGSERIESPIIINGEPVVIKENNPKIVGVLIVAEGANNISVLSKIQQATISLLDININQIEILSMK